jgi:hypothetical protein
MRIRSSLIHVSQALLEGTLIAVLAVGLIAGTAFAGGKNPAGGATGGHKIPSGGSLGLLLVDDRNANGAPNWGDSVSYDVSKTTVANPYVTTKCYQNGVLVLSTWAGYYDGYMWPAARTILLSNEYWASGSATCTAALYGTSTTLTYTVGG